MDGVLLLPTGGVAQLVIGVAAIVLGGGLETDELAPVLLRFGGDGAVELQADFGGVAAFNGFDGFEIKAVFF